VEKVLVVDSKVDDVRVVVVDAVLSEVEVVDAMLLAVKGVLLLKRGLDEVEVLDVAVSAVD